jgi:hypothetical protein
MLVAAGCGKPRSSCCVPPLKPKSVAAVPLDRFRPSDAQQAFLDDLQHRIFDFFWNEYYPETGIVIDHTENRTAKVAATGFGLAAICIGVERGWISYDEGYARAETVLNAFWDDPDDPNDLAVDGQFGLFWHFVDGRTGAMQPVDCVAMCDSADLIAGVLLVEQYFKGTELSDLARKIADRVEWDKFVLENPDGSPGYLSFGWVPPKVSKEYYDFDGLIPYTMSGLADNSLLIYAMALGSQTHPIPQASWEAYVDSFRLDTYAGYECVYVIQLFSRQVPTAFIRFERKQGRKFDYHLDTVNAILADRVFNMRTNGYPPQAWGLTDCFGKDTYVHGAPPGDVHNDGTIGTTAFVGALPHVPELSWDAIRFALERWGDRIWGPYGFRSSYNLLNNYVDPKYVGIELGPMLMLIENYRTGLIWDLFMKSPEMQNFMERAGIVGLVDDFELPVHTPAYAQWSAEPGSLTRTRWRPLHGKWAMELNPKDSRMAVTAHLPADNDLLDYRFARYLSVWLRDAAVQTCLVDLGKGLVPLQAAGAVSATGWRHACFELPVFSDDETLREVVFELTISGKHPALDYVTLVQHQDLEVPLAIKAFKAKTGSIGGMINLSWQAPIETDLLDYVVLYAEHPFEPDQAAEDVGSTVIPVPRGTVIDNADTRLLRPSGSTNYVAVAARDLRGHVGPFSEVLKVVANPEETNPVVYDFEDGSLDGWFCSSENGELDVVEGMPHGKRSRVLRVDLNKTSAWECIVFDVDAEKLAGHRYLSMDVRGNGELLAKLWIEDYREADIETHSIHTGEEWTTIRYDTLCTGWTLDERRQTRRVILFPDPGKAPLQGTLFIDNVRHVAE